MKKFEHTWDDAVFLLHIQLDRTAVEQGGAAARLIRTYEGGQVREEQVEVQAGLPSHRFIVSRTHPRELGVRVEYPDDLCLEAFRIDDRAYYPTESFFRA